VSVVLNWDAPDWVRLPHASAKVLFIQLPLRRCKLKTALNRQGFGLKLASNRVKNSATGKSKV
jgi:hypothetical protein